MGFTLPQCVLGRSMAERTGIRYLAYAVLSFVVGKNFRNIVDREIHMRNVSWTAIMLLFISIAGCGGGSSAPPAARLQTPEDKKVNQAMHDEKAKAAGQPANAPADSGAAK